MFKLPELIERDGDVMAYSKTNWTEATPITADKLNQMEEGIASALTKEAPCSRLNWEKIENVGTRLTIDGKNSTAVSYADNAGKINDMQVRGGSGLNGASGYITFSW